jgi:hypothetical protein
MGSKQVRKISESRNGAAVHTLNPATPFVLSYYGELHESLIGAAESGRPPLKPVAEEGTLVTGTTLTQAGFGGFAFVPRFG